MAYKIAQTKPRKQYPRKQYRTLESLTLPEALAVIKDIYKAEPDFFNDTTELIDAVFNQLEREQDLEKKRLDKNRAALKKAALAKLSPDEMTVLGLD